MSTGVLLPAKGATEAHIYGIMQGMKTTIELPDELLARAKATAAERRWSMRRLLEAALRKELEAAAPQAKPRRMRWITQNGKLAPDLDLTDREAMHQWLARHP